MPRLHIQVTPFDVSDNPRDQAKIMTAIEDAAAAFEAVIEAASGHPAKIEMRVVRHKEKAMAPPVAIVRAAE